MDRMPGPAGAGHFLAAPATGFVYTIKYSG
jgi:hypothetical protein